MRHATLAIVLAACTTSHAPAAVDRTDCVACHTAPTAAAPGPDPAPCAATDHAGYADTCYGCHGTTSWCPADAQHTTFDLLRASHAGWDCADCHTAITYAPPAITDPTQIDCTSCHWHDRARTDPFHLGNSDYTYGPATCLQCHGAGGRR